MISYFVKKICVFFFIIICRQICICLELLICEIKTSYKRRLKLILTITLEYSESILAHVDGYVFVGGVINDHNEEYAVALHGSAWHCTCMAKMQIVLIPTNTHFPLYDESFL